MVVRGDLVVVTDRGNVAIRTLVLRAPEAAQRSEHED